MKRETMAERVTDQVLAERGLPEIAFRFEPEVGIVVIRRGIEGYFPASNVPAGLTAADSSAWVERQNANLGITQAQADAMFAGSAFGWHVPLADPKVAASSGDEG